MMALASTIRVGPARYPRLDRLRNECALVLDLPEVPNLIAARSTTANAYTIGIGRPVRQGGQRCRRRAVRRGGAGSVGRAVFRGWGG